MGVDCLPYIRKHVSHALRWYRTAEAALQDAQDRVNGDIVVVDDVESTTYAKLIFVRQEHAPIHHCRPDLLDEGSAERAASEAARDTAYVNYHAEAAQLLHEHSRSMLDALHKRPGSRSAVITVSSTGEGTAALKQVEHLVRAHARDLALGRFDAWHAANAEALEKDYRRKNAVAGDKRRKPRKLKLRLSDGRKWLAPSMPPATRKLLGTAPHDLADVLGRRTAVSVPGDADFGVLQVVHRITELRIVPAANIVVRSNDGDFIFSLHANAARFQLTQDLTDRGGFLLVDKTLLFDEEAWPWSTAQQLLVVGAAIGTDGTRTSKGCGLRGYALARLAKVGAAWADLDGLLDALGLDGGDARYDILELTVRSLANRLDASFQEFETALEGLGTSLSDELDAIKSGEGPAVCQLPFLLREYGVGFPVKPLDSTTMDPVARTFASQHAARQQDLRRSHDDGTNADLWRLQSLNAFRVFPRRPLVERRTATGDGDDAGDEDDDGRDGQGDGGDMDTEKGAQDPRRGLDPRRELPSEPESPRAGGSKKRKKGKGKRAASRSPEAEEAAPRQKRVQVARAWQLRPGGRSGSSGEPTVSSSAAPTASTSTASAAPLDGAEDDVAAEDAAAAADDEAGRQGAAEAIEDAVEASEAKEAAKATKTRRLAARATDNFAREVVHRWARSAIRSLAPSATGAAAPDADDLASVCQRERGLADVLLLFATVMRTSYPTFVTALAYWNQQRMATPASLGDLFEQNVLQQKFAALILTLLEDREDRGASPLSIDGANRQRLRALLADRFGVAIRDIERLDDATVAAAMTEGGTQGVREHIDLAMLDARTHVAGNPFTPLLPRFHNHQLVYAAIASTAVASLLTSAKEAFQERTRRYIRRRLAREIAQLNLDKRNAARYGRHRSKIQDLIYQLLMRTTINVIYIGPYALPPGEARRLHAMNVGAAVEGVVAIVLGHLVGQRDSLVSGAALTAGGNMVDALTGSKGLPRDLMVFADSLIREEEGWDAERATRMGLRRAVSVGVALKVEKSFRRQFFRLPRKFFLALLDTGEDIVNSWLKWLRPHRPELWQPVRPHRRRLAPPPVDEQVGAAAAGEAAPQIGFAGIAFDDVWRARWHAFRRAILDRLQIDCFTHVGDRGLTLALLAIIFRVETLPAHLIPNGSFQTDGWRIAFDCLDVYKANLAIAPGEAPVEVVRKCLEGTHLFISHYHQNVRYGEFYSGALDLEAGDPDRPRPRDRLRSSDLQLSPVPYYVPPSVPVRSGAEPLQPAPSS